MHFRPDDGRLPFITRDPVTRRQKFVGTIGPRSKAVGSEICAPRSSAYRIRRKERRKMPSSAPADTSLSPRAPRCVGRNRARSASHAAQIIVASYAQKDNGLRARHFTACTHATTYQKLFRKRIFKRISRCELSRLRSWCFLSSPPLDIYCASIRFYFSKGSKVNQELLLNYLRSQPQF